MKKFQSWSNQISNDTQLAVSMPKWYALTAVVDLDKAKTEDGFLDMSKAPTYKVGDEIMFIACGTEDQFNQALTDNSGLIYTVSEVVGNNKVKFEQGEVQGSGLHFGVLFLKNSGFDVDDLENTATSLVKNEREAMVPVTVEMLQADEKVEGHPLRALGLQCPGWYRWTQIKRVRPETVPESYKTIAELLVSMKGFHSPTSTSGDAGETFQPDGQGDGELEFDQDGEITLG